MRLNLKLGTLYGLSLAGISIGVFVANWYFTLPPDFNTSHSVRELVKGTRCYTPRPFVAGGCSLCIGWSFRFCSGSISSVLAQR